MGIDMYIYMYILSSVLGLDITVHSCVCVCVSGIEMTYDTGDSGGSIVCHMTPTHNCTLQKWIYIVTAVSTGS